MVRFRFFSDSNRQGFEADLDALDVAFSAEGDVVAVDDGEVDLTVGFFAEFWGGEEEHDA